MEVEDAAEKISRGGIGVLPTDTIYGLVGDALDQAVYAKITALKGRGQGHKFVVLVASWRQLDRLGVNLSAGQRTKLSGMWPGPVTAVLDAPEGPEHLKAENKTVAVRWPNNKELTNLIKQTGPIIATSANMTGEKFMDSPVKIKQAFPELDFYVWGEVTNKPSGIIRIFKDGSTSSIR